MDKARYNIQAEFSQRYPHLAVNPDLFALVGIYPEHPVETRTKPSSVSKFPGDFRVKILVDVNVCIDVMTKRADWDGKPAHAE
jgi:hypothetical protein